MSTILELLLACLVTGYERPKGRVHQFLAVSSAACRRIALISVRSVSRTILVLGIKCADGGRVSDQEKRQRCGHDSEFYRGIENTT